MSKKNIVVGITHGDINGIGYEVIIKTLMDNRILEEYTPVVYGSPKVAAYHRKALNITNFSFNNVKSVSEANIKRANIINCLDDDVRVELGRSTEMAGESAIYPLDMAVEDLLAGRLDVLVTAPINKKNIQSSEFTFPGHTEYLKSKCKANEVLMIMVSENMKIGVITGHIALREVPDAVTTELILSKVRIMNNSLMRDFAIRKPRIAILSLNPHAGDSGLLGMEEEEVIIPAIKSANDEDILLFGPYPADGFFGAGSFTSFDGILAMYHDQGLSPFKALAFDSGVNYTAGLPVIRTSPSHGTAYELAGKGEASEKSFRNALFLAADIYNNRESYDELLKDPLRQQEVDIQGNNVDELPPEESDNSTED